MACGVLGWTPQAFWHATYFDFTYAIVGFKKSNKNPNSWNRGEVREAKEKSERQQLENPDGQIPGHKLPKEVRQRLKENRRLRGNRT